MRLGLAVLASGLWALSGFSQDDDFLYKLTCQVENGIAVGRVHVMSGKQGRAFKGPVTIDLYDYDDRYRYSYYGVGHVDTIDETMEDAVVESVPVSGPDILYCELREDV